MPNAGRLNFNEVDLSFSVAAILSGIVGVALKTRRGPVNDPSEVMRSLDQYREVFGSQLANDDPTLLVERLFDYGIQVRVNRIAHYTTISTRSSLTATKSRMVNPNLMATLVFSTALIAGNILQVVVDAVTIDCTVYATSNDATLALCATEIVAGSTGKITAANLAKLEGSDDLILILKKSGSGIVITSASVSGGASQPTVTIQDGGSVVTTAAAEGLYRLTPKYPGADYDSMTFAIGNASNGNSNYFNMTITLDGKTETYSNLTIAGTPTQSESNYLQNVVNDSKLVDVQYYDLAATTAPIRPVNGAYTFTAGSDGGTIIGTDFTGDSAAKTGIYAFDDYNDFMAFGVLDKLVVVEANIKTISDYAEARKDCVFFADLHYVSSADAGTSTDLIASRDATVIDSNYTAFFGGGLKVTDKLTNQQRYVSGIADALALSARSDVNFGEHWSFAGITRGKTVGTFSVSPNYGGDANYTTRDALANRQINMFVNDSGRIYLTGNFTGQLANSKLSWLNIRKDLIATKKSIGPSLQLYLEEPSDLVTFRAIYTTLKPYFESKVTNRAWSSWRWEGDQDVSKIEDVVVNNTTDLDNGKYKAKLFIKHINSINEIEVSIIVTSTSVSFEIAAA